MYTDSAAAGAGHHPLRVNRVFQRTTTTLPEPHGFTSFQGSNRVLGLRHFDVQMMGGELFFGRAEGGLKRLESWRLVEFWLWLWLWLLLLMTFFWMQVFSMPGRVGGLCGLKQDDMTLFLLGNKIQRPISLAIFGPSLIIKYPRFCWSHFLTMSGNHHGYKYIYIYHEKHADRRNHSDSMTWYQIIIARLDILGCAAPMMRFLTRDSPKKTQVVSCPKTLFQGILGGLKFFVSNPAKYTKYDVKRRPYTPWN